MNCKISHGGSHISQGHQTHRAQRRYPPYKRPAAKSPTTFNGYRKIEPRKDATNFITKLFDKASRNCKSIYDYTCEKLATVVRKVQHLVNQAQYSYDVATSDSGLEKAELKCKKKISGLGHQLSERLRPLSNWFSRRI